MRYDRCWKYIRKYRLIKMNNRILKFRVYDKDNHKFIIDPRELFVWLQCELHNSTLTVFGSRYVIQQFTGLKDSKNCDIYEGDILEFKDGFVSEIIWGEESAAFLMKSNNGGRAFLNQDYILNFEVIGNIFENPELLYAEP